EEVWEETLYISTAEEFAELAENCTLDTWSQGKRVVLRADISLADTAVQTIPTFGGIFDGGGHTISGLHITESVTPAGLFAVLQEGGVIRDLRVSGAVAPSGEGYAVGGIVGENYGWITGCTFTGSVTGENSTGGIAGVNALTGRIFDCTVSGSVTGDKMTGGVVGCSLGILSGCKNNAYVNTASVDPTIRAEDIRMDFTMDVARLSAEDTSTASSDTGGIAGYSSGIVADCVNNAPVGYPHIGYNAGGVVGRNCGYLQNCRNCADVYGRKDVGGVVGQMEPYIVQNITESTLARLERQLEELDGLLDMALTDADAGVGTMTYRLNRIADYMDSAAGAASNIRTYGSVTTTVSGDAATEGAIQGGLSESGVEGENHAAASGSLNASTQISVTTSLGGLSSAIYGMSGQMRLLSGEVSDTSGTLSGDMRAIQEQIGAISDTAVELFRGDGEGDILVDSSEIDIDLVTLGKASACENSGSVNGDINVGGIAGAMAMEYELDPEDDVTGKLDGAESCQFEVKAIVDGCVNTGVVTAKRSYVGGVCGRMSLGLIAWSENYGDVTSENGDYVGGVAGMTASTVRHCFAKCTLSGGMYVGGVVGSGVEEDLSGEASTVAGCFSMVSIASCEEFAGAVSGADAGCFEENYFVSDTLAGINRRSYTGKAEPIAYETLLSLSADAEEAEAVDDADEAEETDEAEEETDEAEEAEEAEETGGEETAEGVAVFSIPEPFTRLTLTFVADGETIKTVPIEYGESLDESVYPEIPAKEGYYANWDREELSELHFDTVVTAVYTPYVTALSSRDTRSDGRPIFFVEGRFDDTAETVVTAMPNTPGEFDVLAEDWKDFLAQSFSGAKVSREIVEQWKITIPADGDRAHALRYLAPGGDWKNLDIYVKQESGWEKADTDVAGSCLTFSVSGTEAEVAVISTMNVWWMWLIAGALLAALVGLVCRLIKQGKQRRASGKPDPDGGAEAEAPDETPESAGAKPKKERRWLTPVLVVLALLVGAGGTAAGFLLPGLLEELRAYDLLRQYTEAAELTMDLTVDGTLDRQDFRFTAEVDRRDVEGSRVTAISQDGRTLYYSGGVVFLENGNAYRVSDSFPDYSQLLSQAAELYRRVDVSEEDGVYAITAEGEDADAILAVLLPSASEVLDRTNTVQVELAADGEDVSEIRFSGSGNLADAGKTAYRVTAVLELSPEGRSGAFIPEPVRDAVVNGSYETSDSVSEDVLRMVSAWQTLEQEQALGAEIRLHADCGPVALEETLDFYRWDCEGVRIASIQNSGYALYFTDSAICGRDGSAVQTADAPTIEAARLLDIAYQTCLNAELDCQESGGSYLYTLSLDEDGIKSVAYAIAPALEGMDMLFDSGSLQVSIRDGEIRELTFSCSGRVQVVLASAEAAVSARLTFTQGTEESAIPEAVKDALTK
ncbi:MAG: GLUG motif-containing protein, partial [Oscillospiraceae bacterium]